MNQSTKRGLVRLWVVAVGLWLVGLTVLVTFQYLNYQESLFVTITRYPPKLSMSDISAYQEMLRKDMIGEKVSLGEFEGNKEKAAPSDQLLVEMVAEREKRIVKALELVPKRKKPFTDDYVHAISIRTDVPIHVVMDHPDEAEKLYRLAELQSDMVSSPMLRWQVEDTPPAERQIVFGTYLLFAFAVPSVILIVAVFAFVMIRWILRGFVTKA